MVEEERPKGGICVGKRENWGFYIRSTKHRIDGVRNRVTVMAHGVTELPTWYIFIGQMIDAAKMPNVDTFRPSKHRGRTRACLEELITF